MLARYNTDSNIQANVGFSSVKQLKAQQEQWLGQILCTINSQGFNALVPCFIVESDTSTLQA